MGIRPRKRYGQHFLHDRNVIRRIIDSIEPGEKDTLVEIGPGTGALTLPLLGRGARLEVIEIDRDLADRLAAAAADYRDRLVIHRGDVLKFDFDSLGPGKLTVIGNLPYNISTPLLFHLLDYIPHINRMILMVQKEVADRLCAGPGTHDYGRLSIMVQAVSRVEQLFDVSAGAFTPPPKVESSIIKISPLSHAPAAIRDRQLFANLVRAAFSKRRKTIRNALKTLATESDLQTAGIDPSVRPEVIAVEDYIKLANVITAIKN